MERCRPLQRQYRPILWEIMGSKNWCFTLNNYTEDDVERLNALVDNDNDCKYIIFGKEVGESGTPHLQGFLQVTKKSRMQRVKDMIGSNPHLEQARNVVASREYCKKDEDWVEFGTFGKGGSGKRSDLDEFKEAVKAGMLCLKTIRETHSDVYARCPRFVMEYVRDNYPQVVIPDHPLRDWQRSVVAMLEQPADRRKIIFVVDEVGNMGKSWFADWFQQQNEETCQVLTPGKRNDMAYVLKPGLKYLFLDAPRSKQSEFIQYDFLEDLKNGRVFSPKYESVVKTYEPMHIVVCMNEQPDRTKLSADRYTVINLRSL